MHNRRCKSAYNMQICKVELIKNYKYNSTAQHLGLPLSHLKE